MAKTSMIRARVDPQLKEEVDAILQELGLSTTHALTLFYQQIRLRQGLPFAVRVHDAPSEPAAEPGKVEESILPAHPARDVMLRNAEAYLAMYPELARAYLGQFVAICEGQLVDHDPDPVALLRRVRENHPEQVVLRRKVEPVPDREIWVRHPRIEPV